jgi:two-component system, OmpR family, sensor histidine kinase CpxA
MRPRSLFVKIFIWFWFAMAVLVAAGAFIGWLTRPSFLPERVRHLISSSARMYAQDAVLRFESQGEQGFNEFSNNPDDRTPNVFLFDMEGKALTASTDEAAAAARDRIRGRQSAARLLVRQPFWTDIITSASGKQYVAVVRFPDPPKPLLSLLLIRLTVLFLSAGFVCYLLARTITAPLKELQTAVGTFAGGKLESRVISRLGKRHDEIGDLGREFDSMAERIAGLIASQKRLLADISHELRSPLARLSVATELARKKSPAEITNTFDRMEREIERLNEMVGQLLAITRMESGSEKVTFVRVDLRELVEQIVEDANFEAAPLHRSVTLLPADASSLQAAPEVLRSAIENVVRNALRHSPEGGTVEVELRRSGDSAVISVRDQGPGVPEKDLDSIFEPFFRVSEARERESGGVGLGLAIAQRAIRLHRGTIRARNTAPGFLVEISIPLD